jgi:hypothetical protein
LCDAAPGRPPAIRYRGEQGGSPLVPSVERVGVVGAIDVTLDGDVRLGGDAKLGGDKVLVVGEPIGELRLVLLPSVLGDDSPLGDDNPLGLDNGDPSPVDVVVLSEVLLDVLPIVLGDVDNVDEELELGDSDVLLLVLSDEVPSDELPSVPPSEDGLVIMDEPPLVVPTLGDNAVLDGVPKLLNPLDAVALGLHGACGDDTGTGGANGTVGPICVVPAG